MVWERTFRCVHMRTALLGTTLVGTPTCAPTCANVTSSAHPHAHPHGHMCCHFSPWAIFGPSRAHFGQSWQVAPKLAPSWLQDTPKMAQHGPNMAQHSLNLAPAWPNKAQHICVKSLKTNWKNQHFRFGLQLGTKMGPRCCRIGPRWPREAYRWPQDRSKSPR